MVFFDSSGGQGLYQDALFKLSIQAANYDIKDFTRHVNNGQDKFMSLVISAQSNWRFDSLNATDLPIGSTDIVSGQQDVSFDITYLTINEPIQILNPDGVTRTTLNPIEFEELPENPTTGTPTRYAKAGNSLFLDPIPNYSITYQATGLLGITAFFTRQLDYFVTTDTTKQPGFAPHLHEFLSVYAACEYADAKNLPKSQNLQRKLIYYMGNENEGGNVVGEIKKFYSKRTADVKPRMTAMRESNR